MEFIATPPPSFPKNLYPATAVITITSPEGHSGRRGSRRLSQGSQGSDEGGGTLKRIISGGGQRRLSSFGRDAQPDAGSAVATGPDEEAKTGKFYWRVKVGVTDVSRPIVNLDRHDAECSRPTSYSSRILPTQSCLRSRQRSRQTTGRSSLPRPSTQQRTRSLARRPRKVSLARSRTYSVVHPSHLPSHTMKLQQPIRLTKLKRQRRGRRPSKVSRCKRSSSRLPASSLAEACSLGLEIRRAKAAGSALMLVDPVIKRPHVLNTL